MTERIETTLLVVEDFEGPDGLEYRAGDRVPVAHRFIREIAAERPEWFVMEFETAPLDLQWLAGVEREHEARYQAAKREREARKERAAQALRDELEEQERPQPELERAFAKQEAADEKRKREIREPGAGEDRGGACPQHADELQRNHRPRSEDMTKKTEAPTKVQAREACVIVVGARAPEYPTRIVRNNRTGKLAEVSMFPELPPIDPGDPGRTYVFRQGEKAWSDHEAVLDAPGLFVPAVE